jgi:hypothetical protein
LGSWREAGVELCLRNPLAIARRAFLVLLPYQLIQLVFILHFQPDRDRNYRGGIDSSLALHKNAAIKNVKRANRPINRCGVNVVSRIERLLRGGGMMDKEAPALRVRDATNFSCEVRENRSRQLTSNAIVIPRVSLVKPLARVLAELRIKQLHIQAILDLFA